jgi:hypothetical protein
MSESGLKVLLVRNIGFWIVAAVAYPIAHWIPTASGQPPRIFDVLVPVFVLGVGLASNAVIAAAIRGGGRDRVADAEPGAAADGGGR